jgi:hypothetical protein
MEPMLKNTRENKDKWGELFEEYEIELKRN